MKTIILCGGTGTRMKEETEFKPKPLVLVGEKPILWHIMKIYSHYGYNEFILALGYKGDMIKEYFLNWRTHLNDFTLDVKSGRLTFHNNDCDDFKITFAETGAKSLTGERILRLKDYITEDNFMVTYGDGVGDINIKDLVEFHNKQNATATITGVKTNSRFGILNIDDNTSKLKEFFQSHVTQNDGRSHNEHINGGFMVLKKEALNLIEKDSMIESLFPVLVSRGELSVYKHPGKWKCMDTFKEVEEMNNHWENDPFWKLWN